MLENMLGIFLLRFDALVVHVFVTFPVAKSTNPVRLNLIQSYPINSNPKTKQI